MSVLDIKVDKVAPPVAKFSISASGANLYLRSQRSENNQKMKKVKEVKIVKEVKLSKK